MTKFHTFDECLETIEVYLEFGKKLSYEWPNILATKSHFKWITYSFDLLALGVTFPYAYPF